MTLIEIMLVVAVVGILMAIAATNFTSQVSKGDLHRAIVDIEALQVSINVYRAEFATCPPTLAAAQADPEHLTDPWGNPYQYLEFCGSKPGGGARKDKFLVPINSDYDLYSMGPDGASVAPLTAKSSRDDIIRANDGAFIGLASDY
jgi:general secretion pathway protein G